MTSFDPQHVPGAYTYQPHHHSMQPQQPYMHRYQQTVDDTAQVYQPRKISVGCHVFGIIGLSVLTIASLATAVLCGYCAWNSFLTGNFVSLALFSAATVCSLTIASSCISTIVQLAKEIHLHNKIKRQTIDFD
ncbi:hypothetical protein BN1013_01509 [Candidatus Rubidus massiliensis]|nr:hypothetical protein BN1013_01509 [Candidatus Rubidus massiliensis]